MGSILIRLRYSTGAHRASAPGHKATASSAVSAKHACEALVKKLHPAEQIERVEALESTADQGFTEYRFHFKQALGV
ncbi:hypothetical protein GHO45_02285 [Pseudomonas sp. FSL R10-0765]|uniref:hypothetical protein n=1 Tax=Pseudomonas sp. FSL R10-0765 TaxID=2662195 RepID=UPI001296EB91|nr:hypothetical protein [Pseudomonas sp. FSL R10-0765]MQT39767.1 hypothetical protein [Pseudomonas sp. FSL R10-0765]